MAETTNAAPIRQDSDDTIFLGNLPADVNKEKLKEWCEDNFTSLPDEVRVKKPRARDGVQPTTRFGFLKFNDPGMAEATLELLQDPNEGFEMDGNVIESKWAKAMNNRGKKNNNAEGGEGGEGGAKKKRTRKPRKKKGAAADGADGAAAADGNGADANAEGGGAAKGKRRRRRKKKGAADGEGDAPEDTTGRVYCKNYGSEEELKAKLDDHGEVLTIDLKEVKRGPGAGAQYAFATFATQEQAQAAVDALGVPEGTELEEGALIVAMARKKGARRAAGRDAANSTSIRLEKPSTLDLCCRNLPYSMTDTELKELFAEFPSVESARIITRGGRSRGYGFVHFSVESDAAAAHASLNGKDIGVGANDVPLTLSLDFALSAPRPILDAEGAAAAAARGQKKAEAAE